MLSNPIKLTTFLMVGVCLPAQNDRALRQQMLRLLSKSARRVWMVSDTSVPLDPPENKTYCTN